MRFWGMAIPSRPPHNIPLAMNLGKRSGDNLWKSVFGRYGAVMPKDLKIETRFNAVVVYVDEGEWVDPPPESPTFGFHTFIPDQYLPHGGSDEDH